METARDMGRDHPWQKKVPSFVLRNLLWSLLSGRQKKQITVNLQPSPKQMRQRSVPCTHRLQGTALVLFLVGLLPKPDLSDYSDWQISIEVSWVGAPLSEFATEKKWKMVYMICNVVLHVLIPNLNITVNSIHQAMWFHFLNREVVQICDAPVNWKSVAPESLLSWTQLLGESSLQMG